MDLGESGHEFSNWSSTYSCRPELYFEPSSLEELRQILRAAHDNAKKVRIVGNGCSPSDLVCTTDYMICMKNFNKVHNVNKADCTIKVGGGMLLSELNEILAANEMALKVLGAVSYISIAGAMSTGVHGSGAKYGHVSTNISEVELMTSDGHVTTISRETDEETFRALGVSLGALGVIVAVTVQCDKAFRLLVKQFPSTRTQVLADLESHLAASEHFRFMWYPLTDDCLVHQISRTKQDIRVQKSWFWSVAVGYHLVQFLFWISTFVPGMLYAFTWLCFRFLDGTRRQFVDRSDRAFNFDCLFQQYVMEWSIPREKTSSVLAQLKVWLDESGFKAHFPVEVRFVCFDDLYLSPAYGRDSCYINILMYRPYGKTVEHEAYWSAFEKIVLAAGGRPHWAKDHGVGAETFRQIYPMWDKFAAVRRRLDPQRMFFNENLERVFGLD